MVIRAMKDRQGPCLVGERLCACLLNERGTPSRVRVCLHWLSEKGLCSRCCVRPLRRGAGIGASPMPAQGASPAARPRAAAVDGHTGRQSRRVHACASAAGRVRGFVGHDGAFTPEENRASDPATRLQAQLERLDVAR